MKWADSAFFCRPLRGLNIYFCFVYLGLAPQALCFRLLRGLNPSACFSQGYLIAHFRNHMVPLARIYRTDFNPPDLSLVHNDLAEDAAQNHWAINVPLR
jgi:hypothetical protein